MQRVWLDVAGRLLAVKLKGDGGLPSTGERGKREEIVCIDRYRPAPLTEAAPSDKPSVKRSSWRRDMLDDRPGLVGRQPSILRDAAATMTWYQRGETVDGSFEERYLGR